jgi:hypothetical protein
VATAFCLQQPRVAHALHTFSLVGVRWYLHIFDLCCTGGYAGKWPEGVYINTCYSLTNFTWTASTPMLSNRYGAAAVLLPNHTVLISGGQNDDGFLRSTELFNGTVWQEGPLLPHAVYGHCMVYISEYLVMVGGYTADAYMFTYTVTADAYGDTSATYSYNLDTGLLIP